MKAVHKQEEPIVIIRSSEEAKKLGRSIGERRQIATLCREYVVFVYRDCIIDLRRERRNG